MNAYDLLRRTRATFDGPDIWVSALVLRRYENGRADSYRVDDATSEIIEVPDDFTHVAVVVETRLETLFAHMAGDHQEVAAIGGRDGITADLPVTYIEAAASRSAERPAR